MFTSDTSTFSSPDQLYQRAIAAHAGGDPAGAVQIYDRLLASLPDHPQLLLRRGLAARDLGDKKGAVDFVWRAALAAPTDAEILSNLGNVMADAGDPEAGDVHLRAAGFAPDHVGVLMNAAGFLVRDARAVEASPLIQRVLALNPGDAGAWGLMGDILKVSGLLVEATAAMRQSIALRPNDPDRWCELGILLYLDGAFAQAAEAFRACLALRPDHPPGLTNLALALLGAPEALALHDRAVARDPTYPNPAVNRASWLLGAGRWREGWEAWESRHRLSIAMRRDFQRPLWTGESLGPDEPLLIWSEQGLGDLIMMMRFLPAVRALAPNVTIELHPGLGALAHCLPEGVGWIERGAEPPPFTRHLPTGSLPRLLGATPEFAPYLTPPPGKVDFWARRLADPRPKIGLVWSGHPGHVNDRLRSRRLSDFEALLGREGARFFSLQHDAARDQLSADLPITDLADDLRDFGDTAAALSQLDLLISVDTAVLNLAGAMGLPAWGIMPPNPDWRWGLTGETSAWYPTVRLFRRGLAPSGDSEPAEASMARLDAAFGEWLAAFAQAANRA